ncbi:CoA ester lyase [Amycolatopsis carbonis]|uniref:CoA ester lyase n=1 Tax=Amycolatopsis carbonis TaxID=715471 RepID=A0A9Y2IBR2_9PSEU|nr:CoA ester lyase [Amycolatopsis sp. 2-15]WIX77152.1 CoA ester lyase [Amycolatopsis sp. 2-15]
MNERLATARSFLFVPGHRPDRFAKAEASGADVVVLDLEDAVGAGHKATARGHVRDWLAAGHPAVVRINAPGTPWFEADIAAVGAAAVMVPKAEDAPGLTEVARSLPAGTALIPLLESAAGIVGAAAVCAVPGVVRAAFGSVDLAAQLGVDHASHTALRYARSAVVLAAAATGCPAPIDGVTTALDDSAILDADLAEAVTLGFSAKLCLHPRQIAAVHQGFSPSEEDVRWARAILAAAGDGSVSVHEGQMIDRPVVLRAQRLLARAGEHQPISDGD